MDSSSPSSVPSTSTSMPTGGAPKRPSRWGRKITATSEIAGMIPATERVINQPVKHRVRQPGTQWSLDPATLKRKRELVENAQRLCSLVDVPYGGYTSMKKRDVKDRLFSKAVETIESNEAKLKVMKELKMEELEKQKLNSEQNSLKQELMKSEAQGRQLLKLLEDLSSGKTFYEEKYVQFCKELGIQPDVYED